MNKKRKVDDVLQSIFNLIQDANKELKESERNDQNHNNLLITPHIGGSTYESIWGARNFILKKLLELRIK